MDTLNLFMVDKDKYPTDVFDINFPFFSFQSISMTYVGMSIPLIVLSLNFQFFENDSKAVLHWVDRCLCLCITINIQVDKGLIYTLTERRGKRRGKKKVRRIGRRNLT